MADVTNLFKATVKSIKSRNKHVVKDGKAEDKPSIFPATKHRGQFESTAKDVVMSSKRLAGSRAKVKEMYREKQNESGKANQDQEKYLLHPDETVATITKLRDILLEHRKDYVNAGSHLSGEASSMTDTQREQIDNEAQRIIKKCQDSLGNVKRTAETEKVHPQVREHREAVLTLINTYLKVVCKIYSEQKAVRVKRVVDRKRISRIQPERRSLQKSSSLGNSTDGLSNHLTGMSASTSSASSLSSPSSENSANSAPPRLPSQDSPGYNDSDEEISPEEAQMFEQENKAVFEEMNSLSSELSKIQGKVIEIASLQEIFTEKVLTQEEDIMRIADSAVTTTENVKDGNEEIREAMKKNAGFRVWILFFLLVLTFTLLFLDWYSG